MRRCRLQRWGGRHLWPQTSALDSHSTLDCASCRVDLTPSTAGRLGNATLCRGSSAAERQRDGDEVHKQFLVRHSRCPPVAVLLDHPKASNYSRKGGERCGASCQAPGSLPRRTTLEDSHRREWWGGLPSLLPLTDIPRARTTVRDGAASTDDVARFLSLSATTNRQTRSHPCARGPSASLGLEVLPAGCVLRSVALLKDVRRGDRGESSRLTFEERAERRSGKHKEQRATRDQEAEELLRVVQEDFPDELQSHFDKVLEKANVAFLKVLNMVKCLETVQVEVQSGEHGARTLPLSSIGHLVKVDPHTLELTTHTPALTTSALQRINRFDGTFQVTKEGNNKLKIVLPPMTTQHRQRAADQIKQLIVLFKQKAKLSRTSMVKLLQSSSALDSGRVKELIEEMSATHDQFVMEKSEELELMAEEVMLAAEDIEQHRGDATDSGAEETANAIHK